MSFFVYDIFFDFDQNDLYQYALDESIIKCDTTKLQHHGGKQNLKVNIHHLLFVFVYL